MIIHNPEITGSLSFPREDGTKVRIQLSTEGGLETVIADATGSVTGTPQSNFSGSFTGSFTGDGSQITGVAASSLNIDLFGSGAIAGNDQLLFSDSDDNGTEKKGTFVSGLNSLTVVSGSSQIEFNDISNTPFSQSAGSVTVSKAIIPTSANVDLGSTGSPFRDLYLSSASLYIDGQQVISTQNGDLEITTDANQSLRIVEEGADTITLQTENGDITLAATGTGNIELNAPIQILAGKKIISSDGNTIVFGEDIDVEGDITLDGTVDGVDIASFKSSFDTLNGKALVSGSSQIDVQQTTNFSAFSSSIASTFDGLSSNYADLIGIPSGIVSASSQIIIGSTDGFSTFSGSLKSTDDAQSSRLTSLETFSSSIETAISVDGANVTVLGNLEVQGTTTTIDSDTIAIGSSVIELNGSAAVLAGLIINDVTSPSTISGSLLWNGTSDHWIAGQSGSESKILLADGDGVVSGSSQITKTLQDVTTAGSTTTTAISITNSTASTTTTTGALKVTGGVGIGGALNVGGDVVAFASSDRRLKDNIVNIENPIEKVQKLNGVTWDWNSNADELQQSLPNVGVIAQEVEEVFPQLVHDRDNGYKGVDYAKLTGLLIEAIKEQQKQIDELKSRLG